MGDFGDGDTLTYIHSKIKMTNMRVFLMDRFTRRMETLKQGGGLGVKVRRSE